jgi:hypothetical protein
MLWAMTEAFFGTRASASPARDVYVAEADASGAEWARTWAQWCSGLVELRRGEAQRALAPLQRALVWPQAIGDSWGLETPAWAVAATGDGTRAAWLLAAAHRMRRHTGVALIGLRPFHEAHLTAERRVRASLGAEEYAAAWPRPPPPRTPRDRYRRRGRHRRVRRAPGRVVPALRQRRRTPHAGRPEPARRRLHGAACRPAPSGTGLPSSAPHHPTARRTSCPVRPLPG